MSLHDLEGNRVVGNGNTILGEEGEEMTVIRKLTSTGLVNAVGMLRNVQHSWVSGHADDALKMTLGLWPTLGLAEFEDLMNGRYSIVDEDLSILLDGGAEGRRMEMELWERDMPKDDFGDLEFNLKSALGTLGSMRSQFSSLEDEIHRMDEARGVLIDWFNDMPESGEEKWGKNRDELDAWDVDEWMSDLESAIDGVEETLEKGMGLVVLKDG